MDNNKRMADLVASFPSLERLSMAREWHAGSAEKLDAHVNGPAGTSGSRAAARFVLAVWAGENRRAGAPPDWDDNIEGAARCLHPAQTLRIRLYRDAASVTCEHCGEEWNGLPRRLGWIIARGAAAESIWKVGAFDLLGALAVWDNQHVRACLAYLARPFRP